MKKLEKLAQLTDKQLVYGVVKYLGYQIFDCGDHDENSPHRWPGNGNVTELAKSETIIIIGLTGNIVIEGPDGAYELSCRGIVGMHLNQIFCRDAVRQVSVDADGQYVVGTVIGMDPEMTCHVHGSDLYKALCYGFVLYHCGDSLDVPDVLVKE